MTKLPFLSVRAAALALLNGCPDLSHKAAGFCGHLAVAASASAKQLKWLDVLLKQNDLPPYEGGVNG